MTHTRATMIDIKTPEDPSKADDSVSAFDCAASPETAVSPNFVAPSVEKSNEPLKNTGRPPTSASNSLMAVPSSTRSTGGMAMEVKSTPPLK